MKNAYFCTASVQSHAVATVTSMRKERKKKVGHADQLFWVYWKAFGQCCRLEKSFKKWGNNLSQMASEASGSVAIIYFTIFSCIFSWGRSNLDPRRPFLFLVWHFCWLWFFSFSRIIKNQSKVLFLTQMDNIIICWVEINPKWNRNILFSMHELLKELLND